MISIIIPCYNEPDILSTIESLNSCETIDTNVEIIVVVNSSEISHDRIVEFNKSTYNSLTNEVGRSKISLIPILIEGTRKKHAGVGFARKSGMEYAINNSDVELSKQILVSLDADTLVASNYLVEIEKAFINTKLNICTIGFEHNLDLCANDVQQEAIVQYELYLRYYKHALEATGFPYSIYTIGSAFAVRASTYQKQGGMSKRQAGEDFYFLQKIAPLGNFTELNTTTVYPSPRCSDRVPFGTGPSVEEISNNSNNTLLSYTLDSINALTALFKSVDSIYESNIDEIDEIIGRLATPLQEFLINIDFKSLVAETKGNSSNLKSFQKRFYGRFTAFTVVKYVNFVHIDNYSKIPIVQVAAEFLNSEEHNSLKLLEVFRELDRE